MGEEMPHHNLKDRTKSFALTIIRLVAELPKSKVSETLGLQLLRSGTSVGANYRAACRARSKAEFISKMGIVEEEADESLYWMELLLESNIVLKSSIEAVMKEANELVAITVASITTARGGKRVLSKS